ncbi:helix-turn-helix domain-containing protein [Aquimarina sp. ERC-38]|uniref:helix-turn-helix domain-containing protein n=1 Tax=Aquimarina sp. ERC-38 TaxID=2949996 RepID=UPI0022478619|nr:helix-turn-helix domain-containing protein [Aquimarina sp. ERC-38]UZO81969.1 helix-turn-helix domain-containing protein [Aquimarina sp. ERC-38]
MNFKKGNNFYLIILLILCFCEHLQSQKVADSLKNVSYDYMWERYYADTTRAAKIIYTDAIIARTKKEGDTATLMGGYELRSYLYRKNNRDKYLSYLDSIIKLGELKPINGYPEDKLLERGVDFYLNNDLKNALLDFIKIEDFGKNNTNLIRRNYNHLGLVKYELGDKFGALESYFKSLDMLKRESNSSQKSYLILYFNISNIYNETGKLDSAQYYINEGIRISQELNDTLYYNHFIANKGINLFYKEDYERANEILKKCLDSVQSEEVKAHINYYLGTINKKIGKFEQSLKHYLIVDSIISKINVLNPFYRKTYIELINHYKSKKELKSQFYYLNKLINMDSINHENEVFLNRNLYTDYEIPKLKAERNQIIFNIKQKDRKKMIWIIVLLVGSILILSGFIYQYYKRKSYQTRFLTLYNNQENDQKKEVPTNIKKPSYQLDISEEIIVHILEGLQKFEKNHDYLRAELTLPNLAKQLQTNSKYLSKVISAKKGKNFVQYINNLRVNYAIKKLKNNLSFRKYTLVAIANEIGFKKSESFTNAFKKETGITPFYFIKELQKKHPNS